MRKFSKKRSKENYEYGKLRKVFLEENPMCQIRVAGCTGMAIEIHHTYSGKDRGANYLKVDTWKGTCRNCHLWVHDNPKKSRELGYLKQNYDKK